jgi:hypothetical protein
LPFPTDKFGLSGKENIILNFVLAKLFYVKYLFFLFLHAKWKFLPFLFLVTFYLFLAKTILKLNLHRDELVGLACLLSPVATVERSRHRQPSLPLSLWPCGRFICSIRSARPHRPFSYTFLVLQSVQTVART